VTCFALGSRLFFNPVAVKHTVCDRGRGLDVPEHSLRDVFNDVSKYIGNISISLNTVLPKLPDNHDRTHSLGTWSSSSTTQGWRLDGQGQESGKCILQHTSDTGKIFNF
jgi:hypothetical protein